MPLDSIPYVRRLFVPYTPRPTERAFEQQAQTQTTNDITVCVAVPTSQECRKFFGVPVTRRSIQPVWLRIKNGTDRAYRLSVVGIDPNYFSPHEAAAICHFSMGKRLVGFGALALLYLPLLILVLFKVLGARSANRKIDTYFQDQAFPLRPVGPGCEQEGFVYTPLSMGNKIIHVQLLGADGLRSFLFTVPVAGLDADYLRRDFQDLYPAADLIECDIAGLEKRLAESPRATTNKRDCREGDPVNLVVIGDFPTVVSAFGARWDETEAITFASCWRTVRAFLTGWEYRYSPVSGLFLFGRSQDFALQRIRKSINERLHLRLWATPLRFRGLPVFIGQISRDIGVRFTMKTWNLTTHRVDPNVDEARDYVVEDLLQAGRLELAGYVAGVGPCTQDAPRHNLTGDPYFTDGKRAVLVLSKENAIPKLIDWS